MECNVQPLIDALTYAIYFGLFVVGLWLFS